MKIKLFENPQPMTVSEFAEKNVVMQEGACRGQRFSYKTRPYFREFTDAMGDNHHNCRVVMMSPSQLGKVISHDTLLPTPNGFKPLSELHVGDTIYTQNGTETCIIYKTPLHSRPYYRIVFDDGVEVDAGDNHRWTVKDLVKSSNRGCECFEVLDTEHMYNTMQTMADLGCTRSLYAIPMPEPVQYPTRRLDIPPYLLGLWLGDGDSNSPYITSSHSDFAYYSERYTPVYARSDRRGSDAIRFRLKCLNHLQLKSYNVINNKHIPDIYKTASVKQRLQLIQGLFDADGYISERGDIEFTQKSERLFADVAEVLRSLGIKVHTHAKVVNGTVYYRLTCRTTLPVFALPRKACRLPSELPRCNTKYRYIRSITPIESKLGYCIQVSDPSALYLITRDYIVTHNTSAMLNYIYYLIVYDPENTLIILDSQKTADKLSKIRLRPFLRTQVKLESLQKGKQVDYQKSASASNISLSSGKSIVLGSARSASDLCSFACKYLLCDETSRYPDVLDKEGDPITLALQRTESYLRNMAIFTSTPTTEDCTIYQHYLLGTQERWCAVCSECGYYMPVLYRDICFDDIDNPTYTCPQCKHVYDEYTLQYKLKHCYAPPANPNPFKDGLGRICRSFHITGTLVPERYSWKYLRDKELAARTLGVGGYMSFVNTTLGEVYYPSLDEMLNINKLLLCRRYIDVSNAPKWIQYVTCGVDTQDNRFELVVLGSDTERKHVAFLERRVLLGDLRESKVWDDLLHYLNDFKVITRDKRVLPIQVTCIDAGGHFTQDVYAFCTKSPRLRPIKGYTSMGGTAGNVHGSKDLIHRVTEVPMRAFGRGTARTKVTLLNVNYAKDIIRKNMLEIQSDFKEAKWVISNHCDAGFDEFFFDQMNSEYRETKKDGSYMWRLKPGVRNEALDCTVYALCGVDITRLMLGRAADNATVADEPQIDTMFDETDTNGNNTSNPFDNINNYNSTQERFKLDDILDEERSNKEVTEKEPLKVDTKHRTKL